MGADAFAVTHLADNKNRREGRGLDERKVCGNMQLGNVQHKNN